MGADQHGQVDVGALALHKHRPGGRRGRVSNWAPAHTASMGDVPGRQQGSQPGMGKLGCKGRVAGRQTAYVEWRVHGNALTGGRPAAAGAT